VFPLGTTVVAASATDGAGNTATGSFAVTVRDTTAPTLHLPADLTLEASGPSGATAEFFASAEDLVDGALSVGFSHAPGSVFPLGSTTVTATVSDAAGNTATGAFTDTVVHTTPPVLTLPADLTLEATSASGAIATFAASADDLVGGNVAVEFSLPSGSVFPIGTTTVVATARDGFGNTATRSFTVTVRDTTAPAIRQLTATPDQLWAPNHRMVPVTLLAEVADAADPAPLVRIVSVTCSDPAATASDWEITGRLTLNLRAERAGGAGDRVYTITVLASDTRGNASTATVTVTVPHDQGKR
jgi:hypothetical protein